MLPSLLKNLDIETANNSLFPPININQTESDFKRSRTHKHENIPSQQSQSTYVSLNQIMHIHKNPSLMKGIESSQGGQVQSMQRISTLNAKNSNLSYTRNTKKNPQNPDSVDQDKQM